MTKRFALRSLFVSLLLIGAAYAGAFIAAGALTSWLMVFGTSGVTVSILILGAARHGRVVHRWLAFVFALTFLSLAGGFGAALRAPVPNAMARLWLGLPAGAAIIIYIVGLLPLLALPFAYAFTFDDDKPA